MNVAKPETIRLLGGGRGAINPKENIASAYWSHHVSENTFHRILTSLFGMGFLKLPDSMSVLSDLKLLTDWIVKNGKKEELEKHRPECEICLIFWIFVISLPKPTLFCICPVNNDGSEQWTGGIKTIFFLDEKVWKVKHRQKIEQEYYHGQRGDAKSK